MTASILEWDTNTQYKQYEVVYTSDDPEISVQYHNNFYRCKTDHTSMSFGSDWGGGYWEKMTVMGIEGAKGEEGDAGPQGPQGLQGIPGVNGGDGADGIITEIATKPEAEAGVDNVKGMTPLRTKEAFDFNIIPFDDRITDNETEIAQNAIDIVQNADDIAAIVIDSAQIITNKNDIAALVLVTDDLQAQINAINVPIGDILANTIAIADINNNKIPFLQDQINALSTRVSALENNFQLSNAYGRQELLNNQVAPIEVLGEDYTGLKGYGNRFELNTDGARTARIRVELYRKDDVETRFTVVMLEMHFLEATSLWYIGRTWTTAFEGNPDGVEFTVATTQPQPGIFLGQVSYTSDDMAGGNYDVENSYIKFLLEEISSPEVLP